jgi:hypothetical protein
MGALSPGAFPSRSLNDLQELKQNLITPSPKSTTTAPAWFVFGKRDVVSWGDGFSTFLQSADDVQSLDGKTGLLKLILETRVGVEMQESLTGEAMKRILNMHYNRVVSEETLEACLIQGVWPPLCSLLGR